MSNSPIFSDSSRGSAFHAAQPIESAVHVTQGETLELENVDKLSTLRANATPPTPHRPIHNERNVAHTSLVAPSLRALLAARPILASPGLKEHDASPPVDGSSGQDSSQQRDPFEGERASTSMPNHSPRTQVQIHPLLREAVSNTIRGIGSTMTKMTHSSGPPSIVHSAGAASSPKKPGRDSPPVASPPHSRTASPLRRFGWPPFYHAQEDAFIPVDPFQLRTRLRGFSFHSPDIESHLPFDPTCEENPFCCVTSLSCSPKDRFISFLQDARYFILDVLPRQIYLYLLFRLPSLYFSRIARVYEDAQLSKPDLERMIETYCSSPQLQLRQQIVGSSPVPPGVNYHRGVALPFPDEWTTTNASPALVRFKQSWEAFIDSLLREWKTLNLVSALLHSAIIAMFQTQIMANDPIIRTAALLSLTSALMSLSYGCIYIIRFGTMRSMYKATRWAEEAARTTTFILWNVWVLLAMPAVWLAWSMIFFVAAILAFVWRYGSSAGPVSPQLLSPQAALGPRIAVSTLFFLGLLYLIAIVKTLHNYGRTSKRRLGGRAAAGNGISATEQNDAREGGQMERERYSRRGGDSGRDWTQVTRGRERTRGGHEQDTMEPSGIPAVIGLGLTALDELGGTRGLDDVSREK